MASCRWNPSSIIAIYLSLLLLSSMTSAFSSLEVNTTTLQLRKYRKIKARLRRLNKPSVKTIQSPDGDIIDCVPSHLQPAFDHPLLQGQKPLDPPERPRDNYRNTNLMEESFQLWRNTGELCPEETIPIRRTTEEDLLRASSVLKFGRKTVSRFRRDSESSGHEIPTNYFSKTVQHAVGYVSGDQYYGAKASLNVWTPKVKSSSEFSLSQIWVISGSFGEDLNTIEAGWQVSPELYGDDYPRFFTYWTTDAYQATGCYNLLCSGFIQTNNRIAIGAAIQPTSSYDGGQFDISILVWKDPNHGNWWLEFGSGQLVGYWPSVLFSHLADHASMVQFGGEIVNTQPSGFHTSTEMGSGHFAQQGFGRASYFRNLQIVDWDNSLIPVAGLRLLADHPSCYDIEGGFSSVWGNYFYYGGPGRNMRCP
ncbi:hypothetical protein IEQ34_006585 [Dendrobium chrysotoxum]|uniref:Neprosin PEP catalytic domain-containing protein n=1 Tax=Dendrobium chrysotoxum TaxID=161865 RepID=A0AAV7GQS9_DENCH|nr:hypothetical protein IEQ34_006585 [Dendrobium chrysotoxum]